MADKPKSGGDLSADKAMSTAPALDQAFAECQSIGALVIPDDPAVPADPPPVEERGYFLLIDLFCKYYSCQDPNAAAGVKLEPFSYIAGPEWGPYEINFIPYARKAGTPRTIEDIDLNEAPFDADLYDGLRRMMSDLAYYASLGVEITEQERAYFITYKNPHHLLQAIANLVLSEDFPGHAVDRIKLLNHTLPAIHQALQTKASTQLLAMGFAHQHCH